MPFSHLFSLLTPFSGDLRRALSATFSCRRRYLSGRGSPAGLARVYSVKSHKYRMSRIAVKRGFFRLTVQKYYIFCHSVVTTRHIVVTI